MIDFKRLIASIVKIFHLAWWLGSSFIKGRIVSDSLVYRFSNVRLRFAAKSVLGRFWADRRGAVAVEYVVIVSSVFLIVVGSLYAFGENMDKMLRFISSTIAAALN